MEKTATVGDTVEADIFLYDIDIVDRFKIRELTRKTVGIHSSTVRLICYNSHVCYVSNINTSFKAYRCPLCDEFVKRAQHLEQQLTTCRKKVKTFFHKTCFNCKKHCLTN